MAIYKGRVTAIPGEKGEKGDVGPAGATGSQGPKGDTGATGAQGVGLSPSAPTSISTSFGTATRPTDTTKPYKISVMIDAVYSIAVAGTVADTCELWIGPNATVGGTGWVKAESWRGSLTGILTLVGAGVGMRSPMSALVPAGWYFSARRISGTTATITEAYVTLLT